MRLEIDVIVALGDPAAAAAQKATTSSRIVVVAATDPIAAGFVASSAQPGGNITGVDGILEGTEPGDLPVEPPTKCYARVESTTASRPLPST